MESDAIVFLTAHCISQTSVWASYAMLRVVGMSWTAEEAAEAKAVTEAILAHHRIRAEVSVIVMRDRWEAVFDAVKPLLIRHCRELRSSRQQAANGGGGEDGASPRPKKRPSRLTRGGTAVWDRRRRHHQRHQSEGANGDGRSSDTDSDGPPLLGGTMHGMSTTLADIALDDVFGLDDGSDGDSGHTAPLPCGGGSGTPSRQQSLGAPGSPGGRQMSASVEFRTMGSFAAAVGGEAQQEEVVRHAFAASIADPIQRGITLNHLIRDEVRRNGGRTKLVLMRTDDPPSAARPEHECAGGGLSGPANDAADDAARRQEREEALHWATHIDLLTDRLPPTVLFCGGGSMMKTAEW